MTPTLSRLHEIIHAALPELHNLYVDSFYIPVRNGAGKDAYGEAEDYVAENPDYTPITLADVLRVIGKDSILVDCWGNFQTIAMPSPHAKVPTLTECIGRWNLSQDLDSQLPEVHEWLLDLLDKK